jgi:hypothetical protein
MTQYDVLLQSFRSRRMDTIPLTSGGRKAAGNSGALYVVDVFKLL